MSFPMIERTLQSCFDRFKSSRKYRLWVCGLRCGDMESYPTVKRTMWSSLISLQTGSIVASLALVGVKKIYVTSDVLLHMVQVS